MILFLMCRKNGGGTTPGNLANHTSGLPSLPRALFPVLKLGDPYVQVTDSILTDLFARDKVPCDTAGKKYEYSNLGFALLGFLLEEQYHRPLDQLMSGFIFQRYGMQQSTLEVDNVKSRMVKGRDSQGRVVPNWHLGAFRAAGALFTNTQDLGKFVQAMLSDDPVVLLQMQETFRMGPGQAIALGWHIRELSPSRRWHWHNGATGGYRSCVILNRDSDKAVIVLSNAGDNDLADRVCFKLMKLLDGG